MDRQGKPPGVRVLIAKVGLDGHEVGAKVVARALMDAGNEVIYTGIRQSPEMVVETAIQEDVRVIGVSILSGAHMIFFPEILRLLRERGAEDIALIGGGGIPVEDIGILKAQGVREIYPAGSPLTDIVDFVRQIGEQPRR